MTNPIFIPGQLVVVTAGIKSSMNENPAFGVLIRKAKERFSNGDWGDLCDEDKESNRDYLFDPINCRLFAKYDIPLEIQPDCDGENAIYIIQEYSAETKTPVMTILFPCEY